MGTERLSGSIPSGMVIPSIKEEEEVEVEENGKWFSERPIERLNGGLGRGFSHGKGREIRGEISQMHNVRNQQNRQEDRVVCAIKYRKKRR